MRQAQRIIGPGMQLESIVTIHAARCNQFAMLLPME
ncbi:MAG: hypothetical protein AVDCRST_MAG93-6613, partial [uncultured Chloroflexia bacterium]